MKQYTSTECTSTHTQALAPSFPVWAAPAAKQHPAPLLLEAVGCTCPKLCNAISPRAAPRGQQQCMRAKLQDTRAQCTPCLCALCPAQPLHVVLGIVASAQLRAQMDKVFQALHVVWVLCINCLVARQRLHTTVAWHCLLVACTLLHGTACTPRCSSHCIHLYLHSTACWSHMHLFQYVQCRLHECLWGGGGQSPQRQLLTL